MQKPNGMLESGWSRVWWGPLVTLAMVAWLEVMRRFAIPVPNPVAFYVIAVGACSFFGGLRFGLLAAVVVGAYGYYDVAVRAWSDPQVRFAWLASMGLVLPLAALGVGSLRHRLETEHAALLKQSLDLQAVTVKLTAEHNRLLDALDSMGEAFALFEPEGALAICNTVYRELIPPLASAVKPGMSLEERLRALVRGGFVSVAAGSEEAWVQEELARQRASNAPRRLELADGRILEIAVGIARDGGKVIRIRDLTAWRQQEQELSDREERNRAILENMLSGLVAINSQGRVLVFNPAAERLFGYSAAEALGQNVNLLMPEPHRSRHDGYLSRYLQTGKAHVMGRRVRVLGKRKDGSEFPVQLWLGEYRSSNERVFLASLQDLTEAESREAELRIQSAALRTAGQGIVITDATGTIQWANPAFTRMTGYELGEAAGRNPRELLKSGVHDRAFYTDLWDSILTKGSWQGEITNRRKDGRLYTEEMIITAIRDNFENITHFVAIKQDITERKAAEDRLATSERLLSTILETLPVAVFVKDREGRIILANQFFATASGAGIPAKEFAGKLLADVVKGNDSTKFEEEDTRVLNSGERVDVDNEPFSGTQGIVRVRRIKVPLRNETGDIVGVVGTIINVTDRETAIAALRGQERLLKTVFDTLPHMLVVKDREGHYLMVNKAWNEAVNMTPQDVLGKSVELLARRPEGERQQIHADDLACLNGEGRIVVGERHFTLADGTERDYYALKAPLRDEQGKPEGLIGFYIDITEAKRARQELDLAYARLHDAIENLPAAIFLYDAEERLVLWNSQVTEIFPSLRGSLARGKKFEEIVRASLQDIVFEMQDEESWLAARVTGFRTSLAPFEFRTAQGKWIRGIDQRTSEGGTVCLRYDISVLKQQEAALRQSQKMEMVGRLTSGVAHDMNNLLQIISGYSELAQMDIPKGNGAHAAFESIDAACARASSLTKQLLAFSRQQALTRATVDLNETVQSEFKLLTTVLPANIALTLKQTATPATVIADQGMVEQVIMNLAINARDAMPNGGTISVTLESAELGAAFCQTQVWAKPGQYIAMRFSDTGTGMTQEVMEHIFEPFYTTKEIGKGTGLGLSMVFGIVQRHDGLMRVESQLGQGTTFSIYWPTSAPSPLAPAIAATETVRGGSEHILVAEDDDAIRSMISVVLRRAGYQVQIAKNGREAVALYRKNEGEADLAILDIMMPALDGISCHEQLHALNPHLPAIVISAWYGAEQQEYLIHHDLEVLSKPFKPAQLLSLVRAVLDRAKIA
jgi:PAS domain S-box-containing protein